ncbi:hypothetical protein FRC16_005639 [Serendipita sp. 398]|nr:hypothetical protein FRC16_005639 [Serendipita sp. 398]
MTIVKLWSWRSQGGISRLLLENGVAYFVFATTGNLVQAVLPALNLSGLMNVVFLPVAMMISVIASTRVYIRLLTHDDHKGATGYSGGNSTSFNARTGPGGTTTGANNYGGASMPTFPAAPGFDQPYGMSPIKNGRHQIAIRTQTHTNVTGDDRHDLEYGSDTKREMDSNSEQDLYHMRGPKVL